MDFETRSLYFNRCDPYETLLPHDDRNLDLDKFGSQRVRGVNWVERIAGRIELSTKPSFVLFSGLPGSGKSTELRRLAERLGATNRAHFLPVMIDGEQDVDLTSPIDIPDLIATIVFAADATVLKAEGQNPDKALTEGYLSRLWHWLTTTDVELNKVEFTIPYGAKLVTEMKTRPSLRARVRATVAAHLTTFLKDAREELVLLNDRARKSGYRGLVVIFDSLEKLRGITTNWNEVLGSAEQVFGGGAPYLQIPVHVLYTIPPALVFRLAPTPEFMPMIKLRDKDGKPFPAGYSAARELVRKRVPDEVLGEMLGSHVEERLRRLIVLSGGYPREIVRMLQAVVANPESPLSDADLEGIVNEVRDGYRKVVPADAFEWLAKVAIEHYLTIQSDAQRQAADQMLSVNAVMRYLNDADWFDLHPAVDQIPGVEQAKAAIKPS